MSRPAAPVAPPASVSRRRARTPTLHRLADGISEALIYLMVAFTPWAFGTTERWSIWAMNVTGYALGALLLAKWFVRWRRGYQPDRWDRPAAARQLGAAKGPWPAWRWCTLGMAALTILLLLYCLVSALNARAAFLSTEDRFEYFPCLKWLPHSYDGPRTWFAFWQYLGLACYFWALRDWLLVKTRRERTGSTGTLRLSPTSGTLQSAVSASGSPAGSPEASRLEESSGCSSESLVSGPDACATLPTRLRRLIWVLCLNGALVAMVGILQRLDGTNRLLWLVEPRYNRPGEAQFGPYAYRSNAAQYLNLVWPVCLGFWWTLRQARHARHHATIRIGSGPELVLIPCAVLMAASPILSASRGGAAVAVVNAAGALIVLGFARPAGRWPARLVVGAVVGAAVSLGAFLGWPKFRERLSPPVITVPTHYGPTQTNDLTLHCVLSVPSQPPARSRVLVGITERTGQFDTPGAVFLFLSSDGSLRGFMYGDRYTNTLQVADHAFLTNHANRVVAVTMVKTTNAVLYVGGQPVPTREYARGDPAPAWTDPVGSAYFWLFREPALAGAFFNYALSPDELRELVDRGGPESTRLTAPSGFASSFAEGLGGFAADFAGTRATGNIDGIAGEDDWLKLERAAGPGPLQARLMDANPVLPAGRPARVRFTVFNPGAFDYAVSAGWNEAFAAPAVVPAGVKQEISLVCTNADQTASGELRILATAAGQTASQNLPPGSTLYLRELSVEPLQLVAAVDTRKLRLQSLLQDGLSGRAEIRNNARHIAREFPWFGTGPGTFGSVYHLYRSDPQQVWHAYLHDDWLETRVTLGRVGFTLAVCLLLLVPLRWLASGPVRPTAAAQRGPPGRSEPASCLSHYPAAAGICAPGVLVGMLVLALVGCLAHARFDFPFQVYSVLFAFLTLCAIWSVLARKG